MQSTARSTMSLLMALTVSGCCVTDVSCTRSDIMGSVQQIIGYGAAGAAIVGGALGLAHGNQDLLSLSTDFMRQATDLVNDPIFTSEGSSAPAGRASASPREEDCIPYLKRQRLGHLQTAAECKVNESLMASIRSEEGVNLAVSCGGTVNYIDQRIAQQACGIVSVCAVLAYNVALKEAATGVACVPAMNAGLARLNRPGI